MEKLTVIRKSDKITLTVDDYKYNSDTLTIRQGKQVIVINNVKKVLVW